MTILLKSALDFDLIRRREITSGATWEQVLKKLGIKHERRSSGVLVALCVFHEEKTPSLHFWPSSGFKCHGCGVSYDMLGFVHLYTGGDEVFLVDFFADLPTLRWEHLNQLLFFREG